MFRILFRILQLASAALLVGGIAFVGTAALGQDTAKLKSQKLDDGTTVFFGEPRNDAVRLYGAREGDAMSAVLASRVGSVFYVAGAVGGANNCTDQTFIEIISIGGADQFNPATRGACNSSFVGGGAVGANFGTPFISPFFNAPSKSALKASF